MLVIILFMLLTVVIILYFMPMMIKFTSDLKQYEKQSLAICMFSELILYCNINDEQHLTVLRTLYKPGSYVHTYAESLKSSY